MWFTNTSIFFLLINQPFFYGLNMHPTNKEILSNCFVKKQYTIFIIFCGDGEEEEIIIIRVEKCIGSISISIMVCQPRSERQENIGSSNPNALTICNCLLISLYLFIYFLLFFQGNDNSYIS